MKRLIARTYDECASLRAENSALRANLAELLRVAKNHVCARGYEDLAMAIMIQPQAAYRAAVSSCEGCDKGLKRTPIYRSVYSDEIAYYLHSYRDTATNSSHTFRCKSAADRVTQGAEYKETKL